MSEAANVAITTVACIFVVINVLGNCFVCLVIRRNRDMRYVELLSSSMHATFVMETLIIFVVVFPVVD